MGGGKISNKKYAMIFSIVLILFLVIGSVSAANLKNTGDDSNLADNNESVLSSQNLDVSNNPISEISSHEDNKFDSDDILQNSIKKSVLAGNNTKLYYKNGTAFKVVLSDEEGFLLANQSIIFTINNVNYVRTTNNDGIASIAINLNSGNYLISSSYEGNENYSPSSTKNTVKVLPTISGKDITKYYKSDTQYYATFVDGEGNYLNNTMVTFNINGVFYQRKTNENGTARLNINLPPAKYVLTAINPITDEKYSNTVKVLSTISAKDLYMEYMDGQEFIAHVLDDSGKALANSNVIFNINGVFYTRATDNEGNAHLNINLIVGQYIITATNYKGLSVSKKITIKKPSLNSKNGISDLRPYLSNSPNCQVTNSEIVSLANQLTRSFTNSFDKATAIFEYVRNKISYSYYYDTYYGAVGTLHAEEGNCVDQAHLSIALYRAIGLPARYVHGTCQFNSGNFIGHVWAQVLIGDTWFVSDSINTRNTLGNVVNWNNNNYEFHGFYSSLPF